MRKKVSLSKYANLLKFLLPVIALPLIAAPLISRWFFQENGLFNNFWFGVGYSAKINASATEIIPPLVLKLLEMLVDAISGILLIIGCIYFFKLLDLYSKKNFFSEQVLKLHKKIVGTAFIFTLYTPIRSMALSLITTINNLPGQRVLSITIGSQDLVHILIVGALLIINLLMQEAYQLKKEQDLTV